ncbi:MAG: carbon-nitrogen family hydrolase [Anaerolineaceae bacterium]|nr:carbon-nitrogen family hydrolase [Anaerolineaceae bacterium]
MKMRLALAQMQITPGNLQGNLIKATAMIHSAARQHAEMILLPELWSSGYDLSRASHWAAANLEVQETISDLAREHNLWIGGSLLEIHSKKIYNTFSLIDPNGKLHAVYQKLHLFKLMDEDKWLHPGSHLTITGLPWTTCGLAVCYDLRFPELFRHYAMQNAQLVLVTAEWPLARADHWQTLLRARAIENQIFVAAVNAVGDSGGTKMGGHSMVIDPWGNIISEGSPATENLFTAVLDFDLVKQARETIPVFSDRRPDIYG